MISSLYAIDLLIEPVYPNLTCLMQVFYVTSRSALDLDPTSQLIEVGRLVASLSNQ